MKTCNTKAHQSIPNSRFSPETMSLTPLANPSPQMSFTLRIRTHSFFFTNNQLSELPHNTRNQNQFHLTRPPFQKNGYVNASHTQLSRRMAMFMLALRQLRFFFCFCFFLCLNNQKSKIKSSGRLQHLGPSSKSDDASISS
jgi:hypothetical protein